jgi:hypothetical protein
LGRGRVLAYRLSFRHASLDRSYAAQTQEAHRIAKMEAERSKGKKGFTPTTDEAMAAEIINAA